MSCGQCLDGKLSTKSLWEVGIGVSWPLEPGPSPQSLEDCCVSWTRFSAGFDRVESVLDRVAQSDELKAVLFVLYLPRLAQNLGTMPLFCFPLLSLPETRNRARQWSCSRLFLSLSPTKFLDGFYRLFLLFEFTSHGISFSINYPSPLSLSMRALLIVTPPDPYYPILTSSQAQSSLRSRSTAFDQNVQGYFHNLPPLLPPLPSVRDPLQERAKLPQRH